MSAAFPELEVALKYVDPNAGPETYDTTGPVPEPTTEHTLEVVQQSNGILARFSRDLAMEAWIAHRYRDGGIYRREPLLAIPVKAHDIEARAALERKLAKQLERTVSDFNKGMGRAERIASGVRDPWWRRAWEAIRPC